MTTSAATVRPSSSPLRWLADTYEQAQRVRIETGERIRAVIQGRDSTFEVQGSLRPAEDADDPEDAPCWVDGEGCERTADKTLDAIGAGETLGPVPMLGRTYLRHWQEEREVFREMGKALKAHPAYPWLSQVKGIGPTLGCKLLARFDATQAPYASSFWAYAGLDTVPGTLYRCATCGLERCFPPTYNVSGAHKRNGSGAACRGKLSAVVGAVCRVARPRHASGEKAKYDAYAKKVLYLVGMSFLKAGGPYEEHYRRQRARLQAERPSWPDGRRHLTALRITEKLFLSHLWEVWRAALGLPTPRPWVEAHGGHDPTGHVGPWSMVKGDGCQERVEKQTEGRSRGTSDKSESARQSVKRSPPIPQRPLTMQPIKPEELSSLQFTPDELRLLETFSTGIAQALINAMEAKSLYLRGHSHRVAAAAAAIAAELGHDDVMVEQVRLAGRLHDVGKIGIREKVLDKPSALTAEEFAHVRDHVQIGLDILAPLKHLGPVLNYVAHHHERLDGSGYPRGLQGDAISLGGRIIGAADVLDALTSPRAYRDAMSLGDAFTYMATMGPRGVCPTVLPALARVVHSGQLLVFLDEA